MTKKQKKNLIRIIVSIMLFLILITLDFTISLNSVIKNNKICWILPFILYFGVFLIIGYDVLFKAFRNIINGNIFDENFLMCLATVGACCIRNYSEAVAVLIFYQVGEWFQKYAVGKSRKSISALMDIRPDFANIKKEDGEFEVIDPTEVNVGDIILVKAGEKIPIDGKVIKGSSSLDLKALTGESLPKEVIVGDEVMSGSINLTGAIEIETQKLFYDSTVSKILDLVENASIRKSKSENFISKFAKLYTPLVVIGAVLVFVIGGLISGSWTLWWSRALNFLVVSCPCALVISIPLSFFAGIGACSKYGILVKGSSYLEKFDDANFFVFDKTGTITKGNFEITKILPEDKQDEILKLAFIAEKNSNHPIALSIKQAYKEKILDKNKENEFFLNLSSDDFEVSEMAGKGVIANNKEIMILCGNEKLISEHNIFFIKNKSVGTVVYIAKNMEYVGSIVIEDKVKAEAKNVISYLKKSGSNVVMLTGDNYSITENVANAVGVDNFKASLLPQNKVEEVDRLLSEKNEKDILCFIGDGINDAPVLMNSDIGISMGGIGSDAAIEASDIVLMNDNLESLMLAKRISKKTMSIVKQNIVFAISIKILALILSAFGVASMWIAIFADVGVSVIAILNAMRVNSSYKNKLKIKYDDGV